MKRFAIAALILVSTLACTKSNIQYEPTGEISLQPVTEKATKAAFSGTAYGEGAPAFNVWAWWADVETGTLLDSFWGSEDRELYIMNGEFVHRGNGSWGGSTPYYWPTKGSVVFAGYSPSQTLGGTFDYEGQELTAQNYIQSTDISETVDLMWFDVTSRSYNTNSNQNSLGQTVNGVPVVFHHALSWLKFGFKLKAGVPQNWRITSVTLTGIAGRANFGSKSDPAWKDHWGNENVSVWNGTHMVTETSTVLESVPDGVVVIPQECAGNAANLVITYDLKKHLDLGADEWLRAQTITLPLDAGTDGGAWKPGKKYIYTIVFGENEIRIVPSVIDWDEQPNIDIEVQ
ncbi:MAG: fimbrillin family protein [Bacteroidales bacterium]|nr:fimbrillin family protein [Bacteroidales bacterium]